MSNEIGCKVWAESYIVLRNGRKYYVDNTVDNILKKMNSDEESIEIEISTLISDKIRKRSIKKEDIYEICSNNKAG